MKFAKQVLSYPVLLVLVGFLCLFHSIKAQEEPSALVDLGTEEDELVDEALEHEEVEDRCNAIQQKIDQAASAGTPADPKLEKRLQDCKNYLQKLESDIAEQVEKILSQA